MPTRLLAFPLVFLTAATIAVASPPTEVSSDVGVEYVAHSSFILTSPGGTRIAIDPFNDAIWLGYAFPEEPLPVDVVLVTHPHYDHDASYHWSLDVPVFRRPGRYAVGDVEIRGVQGKHSDPWGKEFGQTNTIWVLEIGGLRVVHVGDNGPLTAAAAEAIGRPDVLMLPIDSTFHILGREEVDAMRARLRPRLTVPMHYLIPELADPIEGLGPIDPWLEGRAGVVRLPANRTRLRRAELPEDGILVFRPSPAVRPWDADLLAAHAALRDGGGEAGAEQRLAAARRAVEMRPTSLRFAGMLASTLSAEGRDAEAVRVLERALAGAGRDDWTTTARVHLLLAGVYRRTGDVARMAAQCRLVLAGTHNHELRRRAEEMLAGSAEE